MKTFRINQLRHAISRVATTSAALLSISGAAYGQEAQDQRSISDEEVIVTGTPGGAGMRKLDASFAITTIDAEDIKRAAPSSTADLMKNVPGVWVESSGGVAGANLDVRGFPGGSDAPFVTVSLQGMPIYSAPSLSFVENSAMFRVDETIKRVEGLRGGTNPVYSNGQVGVTTNFLLKEGGEETEGVIRYTTSDYDLMRADFVASGKIVDDFYYMIGGYFSTSSGVRDADFASEEGDQLTVNLTWDIDDGKLSFYHRETDDHGTWYLPNDENLPNTFTLIGPTNRIASVPVSQPSATGQDADGDGVIDSETILRTYDLGGGRGWDGSITGFSAEIDLGDGWSLIERASLTKGLAHTYGFVPAGGAVTLNSLTDVNGDPIESATTATGREVAGTDYVQQYGPWVVEKDLKSFSNDLSTAYTWETGKVTLGMYNSRWEVREFWSLGNQKYYQREHDGDLIVSNGGAGDIPCNAPDVNTCTWSYDVDAAGDAYETAFYLASEFSFDAITVDAGVRRANRETNYSVDDGAIDGVFRVFKADESLTAFTAGINWAIDDEQGTFLRVNSGAKFADFDDYRNFSAAFRAGSDLLIDVDQAEIGYKLSTDNVGFYATLFYNTTDGSPNCVAGSTVCFRQETQSVGIELDGDFQWNNFNVDLNATFQQPEYTNESAASGDIDGNQVLRQPEELVRLTPSYEWDLGDSSDLALYGTLTYVGDRFNDPGNTVTLESYEAVDLGIDLNINNFNIQLAYENVTDEEGATEGDPRNPTASNLRYILPRNIKLSVGYNF